MKAGEHTDVEKATVGRIGRDVAGAGVVVFLLLPFVAILVVDASPVLGAVALVLTVAVAAALIATATSLRHAKRWAALALHAAAPAFIALSVALFAYALVRAISAGGAEGPSFVSWPVAAVIAIPGIPVWTVVSCAWGMRRTLGELLSGGPVADHAAAARPRTSALAVASFVLSLPPLTLCYTIFGRFFVLEIAILALLLALLAQVQIRRSRGRLGGTGFAAATAVVYVFTVMMYPAFLKEAARAYTLTCLSHSKQLALAMQSYLQDHHDVYPAAGSWSDALKPYVSADTFRCPHSKDKRCGFAFNAVLGGRRAADITADPGRLVLFFESDAGWNAHGGPELLPAEPRHFGGDNVAYADGHARWLSRARRGDSSPPRWLRAYPPETVAWDPDAREEGAP
jgi:prepilin-type processing-associated H-X9-DG protein